MTPGPVDRSPARTSATISVLSALLAVAILGPGSVLLFSVPGGLLVGVGTVLGSRRTVDYGVLFLFAGIAVVGIGGGPPEQLVPCTLLTILSWDAGGYGIVVGRQLGRIAETGRAEVVHSSLTLGVGATGAVVVYGAYRIVSGGQPVIALAPLLLGAVLLVVAHR